MAEEAKREGLEALTGSWGRKCELNSFCQKKIKYKTKPNKQKISRQIGIGYYCGVKNKSWNYARETGRRKFHFSLSKVRRHTWTL